MTVPPSPRRPGWWAVLWGWMRSWELPPSSGKHFDCLDGVRGIGILLVVACHSIYVNPSSGPVLVYLGKVVGTGWIGVPLFFVLSGFVISFPILNRRRTQPGHWYTRGYATRRFLKIAPPFWLTTALFIPFYVGWTMDWSYARDAVVWLLGLPNFLPIGHRFNHPLWSLIVEVHFYIVLPLLMWLTRRLRPAASGFWIWSGLLVAGLIARHWGLSALEGDDPRMRDLVGSRFPAMLDKFGWGILFAGLFCEWQDGGFPRRSAAWLGALGLALVPGVMFVLAADLGLPDRVAYEIPYLLPCIPAFLLLFHVIAPDGFTGRLLSHPALRFCGLVSYEWYLIHYPVIRMFWASTGGAGGDPLKYLYIVFTPVILTFCAAALMYRYFSLPILEWGRARLAARAATR